MESNKNFSLIACAKDEGLSIVEWVSHHLIVGFDNILIATNDCSDGSEELIAEMAKFGFLEHFENIVPQDSFPQKAAYEALLLHPYVKNSDWLMILDLDEFLNVHVDQGTIRCLVESKAKNIDILAFYCALFGDNNLDEWCEGLVTELFTTRLSATRKPFGGIKCLIQNPTNFNRLGNHFPDGFKGDSLRVEDTSGRVIPTEPEMFHKLKQCLDKFRSDNLPSITNAQINHYSTKTIDQFYLRSLRGRGHGTGTRHTLPFFRRRNSERLQDITIFKYLTKTKEKMSEIRSIPSICEIEKMIFSEYRIKFEKLRSEMAE